MNEATLRDAYSLPYSQTRSAHTRAVPRRTRTLRRPNRFVKSAARATEPPPWRRLGDLIVRCRVDWAIRRGEPIRLGDTETAYEKLVDRRQLLRRLLPEVGQTLHLTCRSDEVLEDLTLLRLLDQDHALTVDFLVDLADFVADQTNDVFTAVQTLAEHGLVARIQLLQGNDEVSLRRFFRRAARAQASDVILTYNSRRSEDAEETSETLRLEMGFPRYQPGRG